MGAHGNAGVDDDVPDPVSGDREPRARRPFRLVASCLGLTVDSNAVPPPAVGDQQRQRRTDVPARVVVPGGDSVEAGGQPSEHDLHRPVGPGEDVFSDHPGVGAGALRAGTVAYSAVRPEDDTEAVSIECRRRHPDLEGPEAVPVGAGPDGPRQPPRLHNGTGAAQVDPDHGVRGPDRRSSGFDGLSGGSQEEQAGS